MRLLTDVTPLRENPAYRRLWLGMMLSRTGGSITTFAIMLQVYGGMGFTWEVPLHLHLKRARVLATTFGSPSHLSAALSGLAS